MPLAQWYTRIIAVFFLSVSIPLAMDFSQYGFNPESMHKIFHVIVGAVAAIFAWNNPRWWRPFALINGAFFSYVALFGFLFPDFGGLAAFNSLDTALHSAVGITGLIAGLAPRPKAG